MKAGVILKKFFCFIFTLSFFCASYAFAEKTLIPCGDVLGISIMSEGLLVTDTAELINNEGKKTAPAEKAGIKCGDRIISADGNRISSSEQLTQYVKNRNNDIILTIKRNEETINTVITPVLCDTSYKLGIWVKDSCAGIGTLTFVDPQNNNFGALGHGISDIDTNTLIVCRDGKIMSCNVHSPTKGKKGTPGELNGSLGSEVFGDFSLNTENGLFGTVTNIDHFKSRIPLETASFSEIRPGHATILSDVDGTGVKEYDIEIKKAAYGNLNGKNIEFSVTDKKLIEKTGGIVCGMSGSPLVQNGKLIGAVTHVFVNDPTRGYGIFIENMLAEAEKIK